MASAAKTGSSPKLAQRLVSGTGEVGYVDARTRSFQNRQESDTGRIEADLAEGEVRTGERCCCYCPKRRRRRVSGHLYRYGVELLTASDHDSSVPPREFDAEHRQCPFRMVACTALLSYDRVAGCQQTGQKYRALDLGAGDGGGEIDALQFGAVDRDGRPVVQAMEACTHARERIDDAAHWATRQGGVAANDALERVTRQHTGQ